jgi:hypothetical protein
MTSMQSPSRRPLGTLQSPNVSSSKNAASSGGLFSPSSSSKNNFGKGSSAKKALSQTLTKSPATSAKKRAKTAVTPTRPSGGVLDGPAQIQPIVAATTAAVSALPQELLEQYPSKVPIPSKKSIAYLYHSALKDAENNGDQQYLQPAGILSLEQVFLPAVAHEENKTLKKWEAKAKRDSPELVPYIREARTMICESVGLAVLAANQARQERTQRAHQARLDKEQALEQAKAQRALERQEQQQRQQVLEEQRAELERSQRLAQQRNEHPRNKELWAEVLELTMELNKLKKEAKQWKAAQAQLNDASSVSTSRAITNDETAAPTIQVPKHELCDTLEGQLTSIDISSKRIQQGIKIVLETLQETKKLRSQLYNQYHKDHQFHGYQGVKDPKAMIRFLSQDD